MDIEQNEVERIYAGIIEKIYSGEYLPGKRLVELELAKLFNTSRTPVRIVISRLVAEGLADHIPYKGAVLTKISYEEIKQLISIRGVNESLAISFAVESMTNKDDKKLKDIINQMRILVDDNDIEEYYKLSNYFHGFIIDLANNRFLKEFLDKIYTITYRYHLKVLFLPKRIENSFEEHSEIAEAMIKRDSELASKLMITHLNKIHDILNDSNNKRLLDI